MSQRYYVGQNMADKILNNKSVSLVIPRITRDRIHKSTYYNTNLQWGSLRGRTMVQLGPLLVTELGTMVGKSINPSLVLGGVEFKCLLMKLVELKPTWEQIRYIIDRNKDSNGFEDKYIVAMLLVYLRIQYAFVNDENPIHEDLEVIFKRYLSDYRKLKSLEWSQDCWSSSSGQIEVEVVHMDELVEWLVTKKEIWQLPLSYCPWARTILSPKP